MNTYYLLLNGFKGLDYTVDTELEVHFGTIEGSYNQVDNAQMVVVNLKLFNILLACLFLVRLPSLPPPQVDALSLRLIRSD